MDRDAIARRRRRLEAVEALEFERERESALRDQLEETVLEEERPRVDREALAGLDAGAVAHVEELLGSADPLFDDDGDDLDVGAGQELEGPAADDELEDELARLQAEIELSRERQSALEQFIHALERPATRED